MAGPLATQKTRPPSNDESLPASSNVTMSSPFYWKPELLISGPMFCSSQLSAVPRLRSWASLHRFGVIKE